MTPKRIVSEEARSTGLDHAPLPSLGGATYFHSVSAKSVDVPSTPMTP